MGDVSRRTGRVRGKAAGDERERNGPMVSEGLCFGNARGGRDDRSTVQQQRRGIRTERDTKLKFKQKTVEATIVENGGEVGIRQYYQNEGKGGENHFCEFLS